MREANGNPYGLECPHKSRRSAHAVGYAVLVLAALGAGLIVYWAARGVMAAFAAVFGG